MHNVIITRLQKVEKEKNIKIVYACESDSRAWVENRNEERYKNTVSHGKNYDAKNMMHTFRLIFMSRDIAAQQKIITRRPEREFLLGIKSGTFLYEELVEQAHALLDEIGTLYEKSNLPEKPDTVKINELLYTVRKEFYKQNY